MTRAHETGPRTVSFASPEFAIEAVKRAAYTLMDRLSVAIEVSPGCISCVLTPVASAVNMAEAERDFRREVIDQDLRISLEASTEPIRTAILGLAFSKTGLQND